MIKFLSTDPASFLIGCIVLFLVAIIFLVLAAKLARDGGSSSGGIGPTVEKPEDPQMTKITIMASDGKVIEELTVETDSLSFDNNYFRYTNKDGKDVVCMTGNNLVKMVDL